MQRLRLSLRPLRWSRTRPRVRLRMMRSDVLFQLRDATVRRAGKDILHIDSLALANGESLAVLGPNGSGKSTFVNLLTREVLPLFREQPPVLFQGQGNATLADIKRCVGFVSSGMQAQISVHLPSVEVVEGGLFGSLGRPMRIKVTPEQTAKALAVMEELGIGSLAHRDVMTLSTGQARRVLIARALVHDPSVLVFDEPCTGLDPEGMYYVRRTMSRIARSGRAVVLVTHYPEDIVAEIGRVLLLKDGCVLADGAKEDVLTGKNLTQLFNVPLEVAKQGDTYYLVFQ